MSPGSAIRRRLERGVELPSYCACCLSCVEGEDARVPLRRGLAIPWCEDCRHHAAMARVDRMLRWLLRGTWGLAGLCLAASFVTTGRRQLFLRVAVATFLFLGLGLAGISRVRVHERREACRADGPPVKLLSEDAAGWLVELSSPEFVALLDEDGR